MDRVLARHAEVPGLNSRMGKILIFILWQHVNWLKFQSGETSNHYVQFTAFLQDWYKKVIWYQSIEVFQNFTFPVKLTGWLLLNLPNVEYSIYMFQRTSSIFVNCQCPKFQVCLGTWNFDEPRMSEL